MNCIKVPDSSIKLVDGSEVILARFPCKHWIVHFGKYTYAGRTGTGWYFESLHGHMIMPVTAPDLYNIVLVSPKPPEPFPPVPPPPPGPCPPRPPYPPPPGPCPPRPPYPPPPGPCPPRPPYPPIPPVPPPYPPYPPGPSGTEYTAGKGIKIEDHEISIDAPTSTEKLLTQAEYDALTLEEQMNGTSYYITDADLTQKLGKIIKNGISYTFDPNDGYSPAVASPISASADVGGIAAGTVFAAGTSIETILNALLAPTITPTLTAPSVAISGTGSKIVEKGTTQDVTITVDFDRGVIDPAYGTSGHRAGPATSYSLNGKASQTSNTFNVVVSETNNVFTGTVNYAAGEQPKDSKGDDFSTPLPAGDVTSEALTYEFVLPFWFGVSTTPEVLDFTGFTKDVATKSNKSHRYSMTNEYTVFAYDAEYGDLDSITDQNGLNALRIFNKSTISVDGHTYNMYVAQYPVTVDNFEYRFNFA